MLPKPELLTETLSRQQLADELCAIYQKLSPRSKKKFEENFRKLTPDEKSSVVFQISYSFPESDLSKSEHTFSFDVTNPISDNTLSIKEIINLLFRFCANDYFEGASRSIKLLNDYHQKYRFADFGFSVEDENVNYYYQFRIY